MADEQENVLTIGDKQITAEEVAKLLDRSTYLEGEMKTIIKERDDQKAAKRAAEEAALAEQGKFKELYESLGKEVESLKAVSGKAETLEKTIQSYFDRELESVPEDKRALIPQLPLNERLEWLQSAKAAGLFTPAGGGQTQAPAARMAGEGSQVSRKGDFKNGAERAAYIKAHGSKAYLDLPD